MPEDLVAPFRGSNNVTGYVWKQRSYLRLWELREALKLDLNPKCIPWPQSFTFRFRVFNKITCEDISNLLIRSSIIHN